ncbi:Multi antimicrobial extrusion protein like protein [Aduncisulcus paluster]|uniref:Multi antimicrobial extrusion protein like protein n=1 Tax=Aduncisulcus paluster TaxID=2918883 RepID=A0ABQ5KWW0_9EUKA|nr:Multi antimicrobial extrusion protein like protein [Aduncisulcus paluster]
MTRSSRSRSQSLSEGISYDVPKRGTTRRRAKSLLEEEVASHPLIPLLFRVTFPSIVGVIVGGIYSTIDSIYVGRYSSTALSAIGIAFPIEQLLIWGVGAVFNFGASALIAKLLGSRDFENAERVLGTVVFYWVVLAILTPILIVPNALSIVRAFGADETLEDLAADYLSIIAIGSFAYTLSASGGNLVRADGSMILGMNLSVAAAILNVIIDPILIFGFDLGLKGAAISTVISQTIPGVYLIYHFVKKSSIRLHWRNIIPTPQYLLKIPALGLGPFGVLGSNAISVLVVNLVVCPLAGEGITDETEKSTVINMYIALFGVCMKLYMILLFVTGGFLQGFLPLQGFLLGAKEYNKSYIIKRMSQVFCVVVTLVLDCLVEIFAGPLVKSFLAKDDPDMDVDEFVEIGVPMLRVLCAGMTFYAMTVVCAGDFQADNRLGLAMYGLLSKYIILYGLLIILSKYYDDVTVDLCWMVFPFSDIVGFLMILPVSEVRDHRMKKLIKEMGLPMKGLPFVNDGCCGYHHERVETIELSVSSDEGIDMRNDEEKAADFYAAPKVSEEMKPTQFKV